MSDTQTIDELATLELLFNEISDPDYGSGLVVTCLKARHFALDSYESLDDSLMH